MTTFLAAMASTMFGLQSAAISVLRRRPCHR
eukprot:CAMPEP_0180655996 /NCGR_PEP_ID=MMETSP1037_2-20121125/55600_1 /TAXON_ID=632150 /ORGANISM="Azadinium spinosum, Strain 3D9" /LENGTH=30 /DNA_ID= /DNA_START= /DNA_END= /DNA_ORIENTATION=